MSATVLRRGLAACIPAATIVVLCGCGGGGGGGAATGGAAPAATNRAPTVTSFSVTPATLSFSGGQVTYTVVASDLDGDTLQVTVIVTEPAGGVRQLTAQSAGGNTYTVSFTSPGNASATGQTATYTAVARVTDGINSPVTSSGASHTVSAPAASPPPPPPPVLP